MIECNQTGSGISFHWFHFRVLQFAVSYWSHVVSPVIICISTLSLFCHFFFRSWTKWNYSPTTVVIIWVSLWYAPYVGNPDRSIKFSQNDPKRLSKDENFTNITQREWLKWKNGTQQEYAWHLNTQPEGTWGEKRGSKGWHIPTDSYKSAPTTTPYPPLTTLHPQVVLCCSWDPNKDVTYYGPTLTKSSDINFFFNAPSFTFLSHSGNHFIAVLCSVLCAKPLPEPLLTYCLWEWQQQTSVKVESTSTETITSRNVFQ